MLLITKGQAFLLGIIQGLSEFLPISSYGHLVVAQHLLGIGEPQVAFNVILHLGTLTSLIIYFFNDLKMMIIDSFRVIFHVRPLTTFQERHEQSKGDFPYLRVGLYVMMAIIPTVVIALLFHHTLETMFGNPKAVGVAWIAIGLLLIASQSLSHGEKKVEELRWKDALMIGLAQAISLIPGFSRSGSTIFVGLALGFSRQSAAIFSFLLLIPTLFGAALFEMKRGLDMFSLQPAAAWIGFFTSAIVGYCAIHVLMVTMQQGKFHIFGYYCLLIGIFTSVVFFTGGF